MINTVTQKIKEMLKTKDSVVVAVDGRCASGKSTLACALKKELSCNVISTDDFFLQTFQRTEERLAEPGGNIDRERFLKEVLLPLSKQKPFSYSPYDCHTQTLKNPVFITPGKITLIEGSYSCHPLFWNYYDLHIFLDTDEKTQQNRILKRNGEDALNNFNLMWIPLEEKYFSHFKIKEKCDLVFNTKNAEN